MRKGSYNMPFKQMIELLFY